MKSEYEKGYAAGVEDERVRILRIYIEAVEVCEKRVPQSKTELHERNGGLELLALLTYRLEGKSAREAAIQLELDILKEIEKKGIKK